MVRNLLAKLTSLLGGLSVTFSVIILLLLMSSGGGGSAIINLAGIFSLIIYGSWLIGHLMVFISLLLSRGVRDFFVGISLIYVGLLDLIGPIIYLGSLTIDVKVDLSESIFFFTLLMLSLYLIRTGYLRIRGS